MVKDVLLLIEYNDRIEECAEQDQSAPTCSLIFYNALQYKSMVENSIIRVFSFTTE